MTQTITYTRSLGHILTEHVIELPDMLRCKIHGKYDPVAYYTASEIADMLESEGEILCPLCLEDICDHH